MVNFFIFFFKVSYFLVVMGLLLTMIFSKSSQRRLLCMVSILLNYILLLLLLKFEYIAFILLILYIGAISVLFLFITMLVNLIRNISLYRNFSFLLFFNFVLLVVYFFLYCKSEVNFFNYNLFSNFDFVEVYKNINFFVIFSENRLYDSNFNEVFYQNKDINLILTNIEIEQIGLLLWITGNFYIILSAVLIVICVLGSVSILKGMIFFNLEKKFLDYKGALTNKPFAFSGRAWEMETKKTLNVFEIFCDEILVQMRGVNLMRILPVQNFSGQTNWITDKVRFFFDSLTYQRRENVLLFNKSGFQFLVQWEFLISFLSFIFLNLKQMWLNRFIHYLKISAKFVKEIDVRLNVLNNDFLQCKVKKIQNIIYNLVFNNDLNDLFSFSQLNKNCGSGLIFLDSLKQKEVISNFNGLYTDKFTMKNAIFGELALNIVVLVGIDVRFEFPKFYLLLKKKINKNHLEIYTINVRLLGVNSFVVKNIGSNIVTFLNLINGNLFLNNIIIKKNKEKIGINFLCIGFEVIKNIFNTLNKCYTWESKLEKFCLKYNFKQLFLYSKIFMLNKYLLNMRLEKKSFIGYEHLSKMQENSVFFNFDYFALLNINTELNPNVMWFDINPFVSNDSLKENKNNCSFVIPCLGLLERKNTHINFFGSIKENYSLLKKKETNQKSNFEIMKTILFLIKDKSHLTFKSNSIFLKQFIKTELNLSDVGVAPYRLKKVSLFNNLKRYNNFMINSYVANFFQSDEYSKHSFVLNLVNENITRTRQNYI